MPQVYAYALCGTARCGATRFNYHSAKLFVSIGGTQYATARVNDAQQITALSINDLLSKTPNTAAMTTRGFVPAIGSDVIITLGSTNNYEREFAGTIMGSRMYSVGSVANYHHDANLIDYTWGLNKRKVNKLYTAQTVTTIVADLLTTYTTGYTARVDATFGATVIDQISITDSDVTDALTQVTKRAGGDWVCDYHSVVRAFTTNTTGTAPVTLTTSLSTLQAFEVSNDLSQVITRVFVNGGGANTLEACAVGETIIPVQTSSWYADTGGIITSGPQRVTYTGIQTGGSGALVGTRAAPTAAVGLALTSGAGIESGAHLYAYTWVTASGETTAGPTATITPGAMSDPTSLPSGALQAGNGVDVGAHSYGYTWVDAAGGQTLPTGLSASVTTYDVVVSDSFSWTGGTSSGSSWHTADDVVVGITYVNAAGETTLSSIRYFDDIPGAWPDHTTSIIITVAPSADPTVTAIRIYAVTAGGAGTAEYLGQVSNIAGTYEYTTWDTGTHAPVVNGAHVKKVHVTGIATGPTGTTSRKVYRTVAAGSTLKLLTTISDNATTTYDDTTADASLGANAPSSNTTANNRVNVTGIAIGPTGTTSRKVYRTVAAGSTLKLLTTIADNTTTTYADSTADGSLGATAPGSDTSGLVDLSGQVAVGATSILTTGSSFATSTGGWAVIGNGRQVVRYTGISGNTITGIPASGTGSITAAITYGSTITAAPTLTGIPASGAGAILYTILKSDPINICVQVDDTTRQAALAGYIGGDGVQEATITNGSIGITEATARGLAEMELLGDPILTIRGVSLDINMRSGSTVPVSLGDPYNITANFLVQRVTETGFTPSIMPTFTFEATSMHFTFEQLLQTVLRLGQ